MRILSPWFCDRWRGRLINVHPSLLPDFAGGMDQDVHRAVLESHRTQTGCTVHLVTSDVDAGPILLQKRCPVRLGDTPDTLKARVQDLEGKALLEVIEGFIDQM
jgi:folate-dependent phosphoribosylglycinamide formyltransferase PurN